MQESLCYGIGFLDSLYEYEHGYAATIRTATSKVIPFIVFKDMPRLDEFLVKGKLVAFRGAFMNIDGELKVVASRLVSEGMDTGKEYSDRFDEENN